MKYIATINGTEYIVEIVSDHEILVNGESHSVNFQKLAEQGMVSLLLDNESFEAVVENQDDQWEVLVRSDLYEVQVLDERAYRLAQSRGVEKIITGEIVVRSPMPGIIVGVPVVPGDTVEKNDNLVILESMKMENELRSPRAGHVLRVMVAEGDSVEKNQPLLVIGDGDQHPQA